LKADHFNKIYTYVNVCIRNEHEVVSVCEVEEVKANSSEAQYEGSDRSVADGNDEQVRVDWEAAAGC
jgi:hypothetical protein